MGRNGQPIDILVAVGKKHLTKKEMQNRKDAEIKMGDSRLKCPDYVKADPVALKRWRELTREYRVAVAGGVDLVKSSDAGILARYCKTFSEYTKLLVRMERISDIHGDSDDLEEYINDSEEFDYRVKKQLMDMVSTDGLLRLETAINKKQDLLIKLEDRLFLNPLAKVKNIPQKAKEKKEVSKFAKFSKPNLA